MALELTIDERKTLLAARIKDECGRDGVSDEKLLALLESAKGVYYDVRFPYSSELPNDVEPRYHRIQVDIALALFSKEGAEGEIAHSEGGVSRTYSSDDVPKNLIDRITPMVGV